MSSKALDSLFFVDIHIYKYTYIQTDATERITLLRIHAQGKKKLDKKDHAITKLKRDIKRMKWNFEEENHRLNLNAIISKEKIGMVGKKR